VSGITPFNSFQSTRNGFFGKLRNSPYLQADLHFLYRRYHCNYNKPRALARSLTVVAGRVKEACEFLREFERLANVFDTSATDAINVMATQDAGRNRLFSNPKPATGNAGTLRPVRPLDECSYGS
jgi:hypothetical protein